MHALPVRMYSNGSPTSLLSLILFGDGACAAAPLRVHESSIFNTCTDILRA